MIRCGNRVHTDPVTQYADLVKVPHYHASCAQVQMCFRNPEGLPSIEEEAFAIYQAEDHAAELAAERANERFWEEGPNGGYYAGSREEARDRYADAGYILPPGF